MAGKCGNPVCDKPARGFTVLFEDNPWEFCSAVCQVLGLYLLSFDSVEEWKEQEQSFSKEFRILIEPFLPLIDDQVDGIVNTNKVRRLLLGMGYPRSIH